MFKAFGYECFVLFDADNSQISNDELITQLDIATPINNDETSFTSGSEFIYFGKNFEKYMRAEFAEYGEIEAKYKAAYSTESKPMIAKIIAQQSNFVPGFVKEIGFCRVKLSVLSNEE